MVFLLLAGRSTKHAGPLRVSKENSRYFTDDEGRAVYLTGSHTWNNLVNMNPAGTRDPFDFQVYLDLMKRYDHNFIWLWTWELTTWDTRANEEDGPQILEVELHPWKRTGPENALDGKPKFDLAQWNEAYFERLRKRVAAAGERNIYVSIMLFDGWGIQFCPDGFKRHPFHPDNNINRLNLETTHPE